MRRCEVSSAKGVEETRADLLRHAVVAKIMSALAILSIASHAALHTHSIIYPESDTAWNALNTNEIKRF